MKSHINKYIGFITPQKKKKDTKVGTKHTDPVASISYKGHILELHKVMDYMVWESNIGRFSF